MVSKKKTLIGIVTFLVLVTLWSTSFQCVGAVATINFFDDGWDDADDVNAQEDDLISFADTNQDKQYDIDTDSLDGLCIAADPVSFNRANQIIVNAHNTYNLITWEPDAWVDLITGEDVTLQVRGGDSDTCRFFFWENKELNCPGEWLTTEASYVAAGCAPNITGTLDEGLSETINISDREYEFTCAVAILDSYMKCQFTDVTKFNSCMADSLAGGYDDEVLFESCTVDNSAGSDTERTCDIASVVELKFLDADHYNSFSYDIFASGFGPSDFRLYSYEHCGGGLSSRNLLGTFELSMFDSKQRVCSDTHNHDFKGFFNGYSPWFGASGLQSYSASYGSDTCRSGTVCQDSTLTTSASADIVLNACYNDQGSCYDGFSNQDESSIDYGGICGSCDNSSKNDDLLFSVAYESHVLGYFDKTPFSSDDCLEADDSLSGAVAFFLIIIFGGFIILSLLVGLGVFVASVAFGQVLLLFFRRKKKSIKKD